MHMLLVEVPGLVQLEEFLVEDLVCFVCLLDLVGQLLVPLVEVLEFG